MPMSHLHTIINVDLEDSVSIGMARMFHNIHCDNKNTVSLKLYINYFQIFLTYFHYCILWVILYLGHLMSNQHTKWTPVTDFNET